MARLTKGFVDSIAPPKPAKNGTARQEFHRDTTLPGFGLRVTSGGTKTYIVETRIKGKSKRLSIGKHGHLTTEQARKEAQRLLGDIALGGDPIAEKKADRVRSVTLRHAFNDYLTTRKNLKPNTVHDYRQCIERDLKDWLEKPLSELTRDAVELRHRKIGERSPARANNTMRVLRAIFNFAMDQYENEEGDPVLTSNPVNRLSKSRAWYRIKRRQTLLKPHEIRPWYEGSLLLNIETTRDYLHFLLFTGLRRAEASTLTWDDVDFKDRSFVIPDTKNSDPHHLPMSTFLEDLLKRRHLQAERKWVFPSAVGNGHLVEPRTALERVAVHSKIFVNCHDLRRTFITIAESLDIPAYALKRLLNHRINNDITAGYIVPSTERLREPMQRISDKIWALATGETTG